MDRTAEFRNCVHTPDNHVVERETKFYEDVYTHLDSISRRTKRPASQKAMLLLDQELNEYIKKTTHTLDSIKINGPADVQSNFDGIKYILNFKMAQVSKEVTLAKNKVTKSHLDLEPERPHETKQTESNMLFEQENRNIIETTQYEATKQRLVKIEAVQRAIRDNLLLQEERIDSICQNNITDKVIYEDLLNDENFSSGSFIKRTACTVLLCLCFVLLFIHIFYRFT